MLCLLFTIVWISNFVHGNSRLLVSNSNSDNLNEIKCDCGIKNSGTPRDDGDREYAGSHVWPWMVSIVNVSISEEPVAYCGASLINDRYIMTAAHCIPDMNDTGLDNFRIYLGTNMIYGSDFLDLGIENITTHPKFDFDTAEYDISLIKLTEVVKFTKFIRPVCLKQTGSPHVGRIGITLGWGSFNLTQPTDDFLKESNDVQVVSNEICRKNYSTVDIPVTDTMLCASAGHEIPCKGDSGGPLVIRDLSSQRNKYTQIGIISHGQGCSVTHFPAIFSRVEMFIDWIKINTQDANYCRGTF